MGKGQRLCFRLALLPLPIRCFPIYNSVWMRSSRRKTWLDFQALQSWSKASHGILALQSRRSSKNCNIIIVDIKGFCNLHCLFCRPAMSLSSTRPLRVFMKLSFPNIKLFVLVRRSVSWSADCVSDCLRCYDRHQPSFLLGETSTTKETSPKIPSDSFYVQTKIC